MAIIQFPPVDLADEFGLLAIGGDLEPESLLLAYRSGVFPWPVDDEHLTWFSPPRRAVLPFVNLHVSRSLKKERKKPCYSFAVDTNFETVIRACAEPINRGDQDGTWLRQDMIEAYLALYRLGFCHSFECYKNGVLCGGMYGVRIGRMFAGESMFFRQPNCSKLALWYAVDHLKQHGVTWLDCQQMTPLLKQFGAVEIERAEFMTWLANALRP